MDIYAASSNNQQRDFSGDTFTYRTHNIRSGDIKQLSEHTAAACSVREVRGNAMSSQRMGSEEADQENANLRLDTQKRELSKKNKEKREGRSVLMRKR